MRVCTVEKRQSIIATGFLLEKYNASLAQLCVEVLE